MGTEKSCRVMTSQEQAVWQHITYLLCEGLVFYSGVHSNSRDGCEKGEDGLSTLSGGCLEIL